MSLLKDSFGAGTPRIDDEFLKTQVSMYRARAQLYQIISWCLLVLTAVIILVGVVMFLRGYQGSNVMAEEEVNLEVRIAEERSKIDGIDAAEAKAMSQKSMTDRAKLLASLLGNSKTGVMGFLQNRTDSNLGAAITMIDVSRSIVIELTKDTLPDVVTIMVNHVRPSERNLFSRETIEHLRKAAGESQVDLSALRSELDEIADRLREIQPRRDGGEYSEEAVLLLDGVIRKAVAFNQLDTLYVLVGDQARRAAGEQGDLAEASQRRLEKRQKLEKEVAKLEQELVEVRQVREKILFMAWVPDLTLRVGTVILLLFLTQILLASYRYTVGVSGFYLARSDAIQLVQPVTVNSFYYDTDTNQISGHGSRSDYPLGDLVMLTEILTPSNYAIDAVRDPSQHLADLAKAWVSK